MNDSFRSQLQQSLGDGYTLERELGGGGMSRVFLARDVALGRDVVVKVLSPEMAASLSSERFTREIKLAASLQEPHIVPVLSAGMTTDGLPWFTMPFVAGESLRDRLTRGALPTAEALGILRNVAQALVYARTRAGSCIATSSRRMCCSRVARRWSPISALRKP
ncbi:MAG: protein kinase [Gemmatimonadaceae bacterium]|nr:protein kinase [Gemmatimonadaceae bacterium]